MDLGGGAEAEIQLFQNKVMLHIKMNEAWVKVSKSLTFTVIEKSSCSNLEACSNMVANILSIDSLSATLGWGQMVKIHLFQNMVMLHIKLME